MYMRVKLTYIGLREKRKGPVVTMLLAGLEGMIAVCAWWKVRSAHSSRLAPIARSSQPVKSVAGRLPAPNRRLNAQRSRASPRHEHEGRRETHARIRKSCVAHYTVIVSAISVACRSSLSVIPR